MKKTLYSLMLNEEVVREIDRMAHRMGTNRSALINQILADYTSVVTPERRIENIFHEIEQLVAPARDLVPFFAPHTTSMSLKSSLEYKYRPIGSGFKGGEVVPTFFIGATLGCVLGGLLGIPAGFAAALGLVCVFCGAVNCPIASMVLSIELFGAGQLVYFALACGIAYMLSGYFGLYSSQKILYSKLRTEFINIHAK